MSDSDSASSVQNSSVQDSPVQNSPAHRPGSAFSDAILPPLVEAQFAAILAKIDSTFGTLSVSIKALDAKLDEKVGGLDTRLVALEETVGRVEKKVDKLVETL